MTGQPARSQTGRLPLGVARRLGHSVDIMRTLLADDNQEVRSALRLLLEELGESDIAEAGDLGEAWAALRQAGLPLQSEPTIAAAGPAPEVTAVVLLDWELPAGDYPGGACATFVAELRRFAPGCRVIAISGRPEARARSLRAGCYAFVGRTDPPDRLLALLASDS